MKIIEITDTMRKQAITRQILEALPEWFGIAEAREEYINESIKYPFFSAFDEDIPIGFVYLKQTGTSTIELAAMGVLRKYHHQGVGTDLIAVAKEYAYKQKYLFLQVKTVKMGCYEPVSYTHLIINVVVLIPPAVPPGQPPINIKTIMIKLVCDCKAP